MKKKISRTYEISLSELRDIVIQHLKVADHPFPNDFTASRFNVDQGTVTLEWTEETEHGLD